MHMHTFILQLLLLPQREKIKHVDFYHAPLPKAEVFTKISVRAKI